MRSAIYVRQSEDKTGHAAAVARQEEDCRLLAQAKGWEAPKVYADNSISATSGKTRPEFEQLLKDISEGTVQALAVWHLDRLTRSMRDLTRIIEAGREHRVNIACVHGVSLDLGDPTGVAVAQILTAIAAMEAAHKGSRQQRANRQRAEQGRAFWTRRPFGYDREDGHVVTVQDEAEAIRFGARAVLEGGTLAAVARDWNERGLGTTYYKHDKATGQSVSGGKWGVTQVRRVLLNPRYVGRRLYNGEDMGLGEWEPIITEDQFRELEAHLTDPRRKTAPDDLNSKHLLSGIARCGKCGGAMFAAMSKSKSKEVMVYRCYGGYCLQRRKDLVDEVVVETMLARLARPDAASLLAERGDVKEMRAKAAEIRERRDALASMLAEGLLSPSSVREQSGKLTEQLRQAESVIASADSLNPLARLVGKDDVRVAWDNAGLSAQRKAIRTLMDVQILPAGKGKPFTPEQVRIEWKSV